MASESKTSRAVRVTAVEKRAAQVRVKADQKSGRFTSRTIKAVANAKSNGGRRGAS